MVLEALTAPKGVSSTPNARRDDCVLTRRCLQGDGQFRREGLIEPRGKDRIVLVDGLVSDRPTTNTNSANQHSQRNDQSPSWRAPAVTLGPSILLVLYATIGTISTIVGALARPGSRRRRLLLRAPLVGGALLPWVYLLLVRPWHLNWSVTQEEAHRPLSYDHLVPRPLAQITHAITMNAPTEEVWKWLGQRGQGGGGMYSYHRLGNTSGLGM